MEVAWHMTKNYLNDFPDGLLKKLSVVNGELNVLYPSVGSCLVQTRPHIYWR
jgi:hypothetical protein